jgi:predicted sulfurtransferase
MKKRKFTPGFLFLLSVILVSAWSIAPVSAKSVGIITKEELKKKLEDADLLILDVRSGKDWKSSEFKIQGAVRTDPKEFTSWGSKFEKDKKLVLY